MMKFPSASVGGMSPSGNSLALTYPGVLGSRPGGAGRAGRLTAVAGGSAATAVAGFAPAIRPINKAVLNTFVCIGGSFCQKDTHSRRSLIYRHSAHIIAITR